MSNRIEPKWQQVCHPDGDKLFDIGWSEESSFFCLIWAKSRQEAEVRWRKSFKEKWSSGLLRRRLLGRPVITKVVE